MTERNPLLFIHGGPGMNSYAEHALLAPLVTNKGFEPTFWNEPSKDRPEGFPFDPANAFMGLVESVKKQISELRERSSKVHIVCLSFAVHPLFNALLEDSRGIDSILIVSPVFHFKKEIWNIIGFAEKDFEENAPDKAAALKKLRRESERFFDEKMQQALQIGAEDESLFTNYWHNKTAMANYFGVWEKFGATLDLVSFFSAMGQFATIDESFSGKSFEIPTTVVFGKHDRVVHQDDEIRKCKELFPNLTIHTFDQSGHYPHIEETERFLDLLSRQ